MRWLHSAKFDLGLVFGPPLAAVLLVLAVPALRSPEMPAWGWVVFVIGIDVAHVYASLYRTYFDPAERARRRTLHTGALGLFVLRQIHLAATGRALNWGKIGIVASTAAVWYVGIVLLNSDFAFIVTNAVAHGVPYFALVWLYGRRKWEGGRSWLARLHRPATVGLFVGLLAAFAYFEEGLWHLFVWKEHPVIFGGLTLAVEAPLSLLVPLLALPQATHYVLDAWIWRFNDSNPGLRRYLFQEGISLTPPAPAKISLEFAQEPR